MREFSFSALPYDLMPALRERADQMLQLGLDVLAHADTFPQVPATAWCSSSTLHRGCYHPSPVVDLIVGNVKRGKLCRDNNRRLTHRYGFDSEGRLLSIETVYQGKTVKTEYLFHEAETILGISIDADGTLCTVSRERYSSGRLCHWVLAQCDAAYGQPRCCSYHEEEYLYDDEGLSQCHWIDFTPPNGFPADEVYTFERENGFLVAYSSGSNGSRYVIKEKRKA